MKHRSKFATRKDFTSYWSLPFFLKGRKNKTIVIKCEICNPKPNKYNRAQFKKTFAKGIQYEL